WTCSHRCDTTLRRPGDNGALSPRDAVELAGFRIERTAVRSGCGPGPPLDPARDAVGEVAAATPLQPKDVHPRRHRAGFADVVEGAQGLLVTHGGASALGPGVDVVALRRGVRAAMPQQGLVFAAQPRPLERLSPLRGRERALRVAGLTGSPSG